MKRFLIFSALCLSPFLMNCGSDDGPVISEVTGVVTAGTMDNGLIQCGWLIEINGLTYHPNVLNSQYQEEGLRVAMKVEFLDERSTCAASTIAPFRLRIEQIRLAD